MALASTPTDIGAGLDGAKASLQLASYVPGYIYDSPEIFALEKERLFMCEWLMIGRIEEFPRPGDYMTFRVMGEPIVVARDGDGHLNAFANVCAHRGVEVATGCGNAEEFSCPYHGWLYDLTGRLVGAPYMKEADGFAPDACRLTPIKLDVWAGSVFINFDPDASPLAAHVAEFDQEFGFLQMGDCRLSEGVVYEFDCNWKFVAENLMDIYHIGTLHAQSFARFSVADSYRFNLRDRGRFGIHYEAALITSDGKTRFGAMPWLADRPESLACVGFLPPNMNLLARYDYARPIALWPLAPNKTQAIAYHLFPATVREQPDFDAKARDYHDYMKVVFDEDLEMVQSLQRGMGSCNFTPGRMSKLEMAIHHILNHYFDLMFDTSD